MEVRKSRLERKPSPTTSLPMVYVRTLQLLGNDAVDDSKCEGNKCCSSGPPYEGGVAVGAFAAKYQ